MTDPFSITGNLELDREIEAREREADDPQAWRYAVRQPDLYWSARWKRVRRASLFAGIEIAAGRGTARDHRLVALFARLDAFYYGRWSSYAG